VIGAIALAHGDDPRLAGRLASYQRRALEDIAACGTEACGVHRQICDHCGDQRMVPNTCQNRSCPHCQGRERAVWVAAREQELLPCSYFHVVMTLPPDLRALALAFKVIVLGAMLRAASDAIDHLCRDPRYLGGEVGQLAVLHTWRRDLGWHPHVHLIVTAGGWDEEHQRWINARTFGKKKKPFLLPVEVLRVAFQRRLRRLLLQAYARGEFNDGPHQAFPELASERDLRAHLARSLERRWVIRIEPPFGGPQTLLKYLGAYVNRVAISPQRITAYDPIAGTVTYTWRTNAAPNEPQSATIDAVEFLHRFAQHILPPRFQRIRFRGLWSTAHRRTKMHIVRLALGQRTPPPPTPLPPPTPTPCPVCGLGHYQRIREPRPRQPPGERRRILAALRRIRRTATPVETTIPA
jgi:hypothetical protein